MTGPYWQGSWRCRGQSFIIAGVIRASTWVFLALQAHRKEKVFCNTLTISRCKTRHWEQQKLSQQSGTTVSGCWSRGSRHNSSLMSERRLWSYFPSSSFSPSSPSPFLFLTSALKLIQFFIITFKSFMWKNANQTRKVDCFLPRVSVGLTHWDLRDTYDSEYRVNRASTNMDPLFLANEQLEQLTVPCVTTVSMCTWHILFHSVHYKKVVHPAVTTFTLRSAAAEADRTMSLPCGACPGSLFEQFQNCCAVILVAAHGHS